MGINEYMKYAIVNNLYFADKEGNVYSKGRKLKQSMTGSGYRKFAMSINGKPKTIMSHRFIWMYFNQDDIGADLVVDHINRNKLDNRLENLRLVTQYENCMNTEFSKITMSKITMDDAREIRSLYNDSHVIPEELAKMYGVSRSNIITILNNKSWKDDKYVKTFKHDYTYNHPGNKEYSFHVKILKDRAKGMKVSEIAKKYGYTTNNGVYVALKKAKKVVDIQVNMD